MLYIESIKYSLFMMDEGFNIESALCCKSKMYLRAIPLDRKKGLLNNTGKIRTNSSLCLLSNNTQFESGSYSDFVCNR